jgi:hypothetical protein
MWRIVFYIAGDDKGNLGRIGVSFLGYVRVLAVKKMRVGGESPYTYEGRLEWARSLDFCGMRHAAIVCDRGGVRILGGGWKLIRGRRRIRCRRGISGICSGGRRDSF